MRYISILVIGFCVCLSIQSAALRAAGGKTIKSESNYYSSIARIQAGCTADPRMMLLGSSITGRLPDRAQGFEGVANMGVDAGSAIDTLRAMHCGDLPVAPCLFIEVNTLVLGLLPRTSQIMEALNTPHYLAGMAWPQLGASARPSALLYSPIHQWKIGRPHGAEGLPLPVVEKPTIQSRIPELSDAERILAEELAGILSDLGDRRTKSVLVVYPKSQSEASPNHRMARAISVMAGIPFWDLAQGVPPESVAMTDDTHMAPATAAACMRSLLREQPFDY